MKTIEQVRRENLLRLVSAAGSIQAVADRIERSHAQVSQWKNGTPRSGGGRPAVIESDSARMIESKFGKVVGWMDHDHDLWPLSTDLLTALQRLTQDHRHRIEDTVRANLGMPLAKHRRTGLAVAHSDDDNDDGGPVVGSVDDSVSTSRKDRKRESDQDR